MRKLLVEIAIALIVAVLVFGLGFLLVVENWSTALGNY